MSFVDLENVLWDGFHWVDIPGDILSIITKRKFHEIYLSKKMHFQEGLFLVIYGISLIFSRIQKLWLEHVQKGNYMYIWAIIKCISRLMS